MTCPTCNQDFSSIYQECFSCSSSIDSDQLQPNSIICPACTFVNNENSKNCNVCCMKFTDSLIYSLKNNGAQSVVSCENCGFKNQYKNDCCHNCSENLKASKLKHQEKKCPICTKKILLELYD